MTLPSLSTETIFKVSSCLMMFLLDLHTIQHQQAQDPVLKTVYHWIRQNVKPEYPTTFNTWFSFLHAYYKIFSQLFVDDGTNLISLYTKNKSFSDT